MMSFMHWCIIFTLVPLALCHRPLHSMTIDQVIHTLTRALNFFSAHLYQTNLDAGIGTRIAADQLRPYIFSKQGESIKEIVDLSERVTRQIIQSVRYRQPNYYEQLSFLLMPGTFEKIEPFQFHRRSYKYEEERNCSSTKFIEKISDQCLHALGFAKCSSTESCVKLLYDPYACRYSLTHQILYSIIAKRSSCYHHYQMTPFNEYELISRMFNETQTIANENFPESNRDLFMEEIAFGGLVGWSEFFQDRNWFRTIMSWQHPIEGCYGNDTNYMNKREEMQMLNQCLSHRTSVAIAALSQMLRFMLSSDI